MGKGRPRRGSQHRLKRTQPSWYRKNHWLASGVAIKNYGPRMSELGTKRTWRHDLLFVRFRREADMHRLRSAYQTAANDPNRSYARSKSRSAAISCLLSWVLSFRSKAREALN